MNRRQRARKLDKRRLHSGHKKPSKQAQIDATESFIKLKLPTMTKPTLHDYCDSLGLKYTTKTTKGELIDMIGHRLRDNIHNNITA